MPTVPGTDRGRGRLGKAAPLLEWQTCDSEAEWQSSRLASALISVPAQPPRPHWLRRYWFVGAAILIILLAAGTWAWYSANQGLAKIEGELRDSVELELWQAARTENAARSPSVNISSMEVLALHRQIAILKVIIEPGPGQAALRQTRVYQYGTEGWQRIAPTAQLWGEARTLETDSFVFHYFAHDEPAVIQAAAKVDRLFPTLVTNFYTSLPANAKFHIKVDPAHPPGALPSHRDPNAPLVVASPATYLAPVTLSEAELLAQSIVLGLIFEPTTQPIPRRDVDWYRLVHGLRLWQLWELDVPLAAWRESMVAWVFAQAEHPEAGIILIEPESYTAFCSLHRLWMVSPLEIHLPVNCGNSTGSGRGDLKDKGHQLVAWHPSYEPPLTLAQFVPISVAPLDRTIHHDIHPGYAVVLATVIDYVEEQYGQDRLMRLLARVNMHKSWKTLAPAVFHVSASEFEAGWRSYLLEKYGVKLAE